jgi:hypothetical protein
MLSQAFLCGLTDGADWDLLGFSSIKEAVEKTSDWDASTINAMGHTTCSHAWGVEKEEEFDAACEAYNRGVCAAIRERSANSARIRAEHGLK